MRQVQISFPIPEEVLTLSASLASGMERKSRPASGSLGQRSGRKRLHVGAEATGGSTAAHVSQTWLDPYQDTLQCVEEVIQAGQIRDIPESSDKDRREDGKGTREDHTGKAGPAKVQEALSGDKNALTDQ